MLTIIIAVMGSIFLVNLFFILLLNGSDVSLLLNLYDICVIASIVLVIVSVLVKTEGTRKDHVFVLKQAKV